MNPIVAWLWVPLIAVQFLTRLPIKFIPQAAFDAGGQRKALIFFPLVGVVTGSAVGWTLVALSLSVPQLAAGIIAVVVGVVLTGAFHEDGLADTCDALGTYTRDDALSVMRDSRIGTFGAVALWALLTMKAVVLPELRVTAWPADGDVGSRAGHPWLVVGIVVAAHVLARWSSLPLAFALPYAREGEGLGSRMASVVTRREFVVGTLLMAVLMVLAVGVHLAVAFTGIAVVVAVGCGIFFRSRFGGVTGDTLGAANQLVEVAVLLFACITRAAFS